MGKKLSEMTLAELWQLFPIFLTEHQKCWNDWYKEEEQLLKELLPKEMILQISHIGSTAIENIWAKPIVDILVEIPKECDMTALIEILAQCGYRMMRWEETRMSFNKGYTEEGFAERVYHLHLRFAGDNNEIYFRDYLNVHSEVAKEYEALKLGLWEQFEYNRDGYTEAKTEFVKKYTEVAKMREQLNHFCEEYGLGTVVSEPHTVSGGLLHKMYRVETNQGIYAVKVLNPEIMQRPEALQNMIHSEKVSHALKLIVPLVAAKEFDGSHVVKFNGTYFMVFDWLEGASVFAPDITVEHCAKIGHVLGNIHAAKVQVEGMEPEAEVREAFEWEELSGKLADRLQQESTGSENAKRVLEQCQGALNDFLPELLCLDMETVAALKQLSTHQVISHRDLDPKNVMWQGEQPYLIDWEAAGFVTPYQELVEVLNYWITDEDGTYNDEKFKAVMSEYAASIDVKSVDWDVVLAASFDGMLGWLEYNVKRAAGLVGSGEKERLAGAEQTIGTIAELKRQKAQMVQLRNWLGE